MQEAEAERDAIIRKKVTLLFNKKESDFPSLDAFKDYEEKVEDIIYNLVNNIDIEQTNQYIETYKQENSRDIAVNQFRRKEELIKEAAIIRELEEAVVTANMKYQVDMDLIIATVPFETLLNCELLNIILKESFMKQKEDKRESKRQLNQIMLGVSSVDSSELSFHCV